MCASRPVAHTRKETADDVRESIRRREGKSRVTHISLNVITQDSRRRRPASRPLETSLPPAAVVSPPRRPHDAARTTSVYDLIIYDDAHTAGVLPAYDDSPRTACSTQSATSSSPTLALRAQASLSRPKARARSAARPSTWHPRLSARAATASRRTGGASASSRSRCSPACRRGTARITTPSSSSLRSMARRSRYLSLRRV